MGLDFEMNFPYPVILKPSDSISYWEHPFATQNKIYTIKDRKELEKVIRDIYGAGYTDKLIIQDMIPGNDEYMRVLTSYSDRNGKVKMIVSGTCTPGRTHTTRTWKSCSYHHRAKRRADDEGEESAGRFALCRILQL